MFTRVSTLLSSSVQRLGVAPQVRAHKIIEATNTFFQNTPTLNDGAEAVRYSQNVITVRVDHPAAAEVVQQHEQALLEYLRGMFPRLVFRRLRFIRATKI